MEAKGLFEKYVPDDTAVKWFHTAFLLAVAKDLGSTSRFKNSMIVMSNVDAVNALISGTTGVEG